MEFKEAIGSGDMRIQLLAIRDAIANELAVQRCQTCTASRLRTGDQAALYLRLQTVLNDLAALPDPNAEADPLEEIQRRRGNVVELRPA